MKVKFYTGNTVVEDDFVEPVSINEFRFVVDEEDPENPNNTIKKETGDNFRIIMSNVPDDLRSDIVQMCRKYCNID